MGTDIDGIFGHQLRFPPVADLPMQMQAKILHDSPFIYPEWSWDKRYANEPLLRCIDNHHGFIVWIGKHAGTISTGTGWDQVADDMELKDEVNSAVFAIARFFNSPEVVFLPDDVEPWCNIKDLIFEQGLTFEEFVTRLKHVQEPCTDFKSAIKRQPEYVIDGYLVLKVPG
jgi:hypothetical protein